MNRLVALLSLSLMAALAPNLAPADEIKNPIAVYAGLDKITGRVVTFEAQIDETVQFGALQITPRACYTKPPTEAPQTVTFTQVDQVNAADKTKRIFSGWMFAASPGLNGIEHPVYDVWLVDCKGGTQIVADAADAPTTEAPAAAGAAASPGAAPSQHEFSAAKAAAIIDGSAGPSGGRSRSSQSSRSSRDRSRQASAPALGAPIDIGKTPDEVVDQRTLAPPGPLPRELSPPTSRPMRKFFPAVQDDRPPRPPLDVGR